MRILHVLHTFPPLSHGGVETYVAAIAQASEANGDPVLIVAGREAGAEGRISDETIDGLRLRRLPARTGERADGFHAETGEILAETIREFSPDVVHVHHWHNLSNDVVRVAKGQGVAVVVSLHDYFATCPFFHRLPTSLDLCDAAIDRSVCVDCVSTSMHFEQKNVDPVFSAREIAYRDELRAADRILALSESSRDYLARVTSLAEFSILAVPLPLPEMPTVAPSIVRRTPGIDLEIASFGGLVPGKGFHVILGAIASLAEPRRVRVVHYGRVLDAGYHAQLAEAARGLDVTIHGKFDWSEALAKIAAADVAIFASLFAETHGYVVDEAMMLGLPVVVSDRGAPPERIGARGMTFPPGDVSALARILAAFLDDPERLASMRRAPMPKRPTAIEHTAKLREIYAEAIDENRRSRGGG